ncbi:nuclear transport factor 2 family protein [Nocardioides sp. MAH-18]|uniref:Nuclear transport factor 2 family protein n=1 Tax=Nocardioides agri TaxID=2682843 RepID=A0A6L6XT35_9ACTN|nr:MULTISPECIES: nuclear transport factor 2 family protein [unclassified Nocardioides]MBA2955510.1 nuclear transport factor 2 family protein [Nocardioides sp. CGMCC 1.13656]MVQ50360.1 nuclear transport factor 2 family protein [Nocardioides sp. MAH-18]
MSLTRAEIEEFWGSWLDINRKAEQSGDWRVMAEWYAEDATYGWMLTPDEHFMAVGRGQIRDWAIGIEMDGFDGWHYDYMATVIDERNAMVVGFWKQRSGIVDDATGREFEVPGLGGSWFGIERQPDGELKFAWQRDWFDFGAMAHTMGAVVKSGKAPDTLMERLKVFGLEVPGHYRPQDLPSTVWPPPVERGDFITQEDAR